jgi:hypothetical protein
MADLGTIYLAAHLSVCRDEVLTALGLVASPTAAHSQAAAAAIGLHGSYPLVLQTLSVGGGWKTVALAGCGEKPEKAWF